MNGDTSRRVWRNTLTMVGTWIAATALLFILSFLWFDLVSHEPSPYLGLFTYLLFPGFLVLGLALMVGGLIWKRNRLRRRFGNLSQLQYYPRLDLNHPPHRRVLIGAALAVAVTVLFVGVMSYQGYHYTDSNQFCGGICHSVMAPQYTAHQSSPHARVPCAACHIGRGANWYVKSKLSGVRQVLAVVTDSFPRPIPPAIIELRPATETCEQCHWPEKFYGDQLVSKHRFADDEASTERTVRLLVKTGGSDPTTGPTTGIHWHMALSHDIEFVATDDELQEIPWVRAVDHRTGKTKIYRSDGLTSDDPPPSGVRRSMDCMDCHNRATHVFRSPDEAADSMLNAQPELRKLPYAKRQLVAAVLNGYRSRDHGLDEVPDVLTTYYQENYPDLAEQQASNLEALAEAARQIYRVNFFPGMEVDWRTYPNNIGHLVFPGCFRCHAGDHVDEAGGVLTHECEACHEFLVPEEGVGEPLVRTGEFAHPVAFPPGHEGLRCDGCHTGGLLPEPTCEGCHADVIQFFSGTGQMFEDFEIEADAMDGMMECTDCHNLDEPLTAVEAACQNCHDEDEYAGLVDKWRVEYDELRKALQPMESARSRRVLEALRRAGPLHNFEATRKILRALASEGPVVTAKASQASR